MTDQDPKSREKTRAVALHYKESDELPRVLASGVDDVARQIIRLAEENNIPIRQDTVLTEMLSKVGEGANISRESFRLVAEIISFLYHTDKEWGENHPGLIPLLGQPAVSVAKPDSSEPVPALTKNGPPA